MFKLRFNKNAIREWAIVKHHDGTIYMVRETKSNKDLLKLRTSEDDKINCGKKHFKALNVPFGVVVRAKDV